MLTLEELVHRADKLANKWRTLHSVNTHGDHHVKIEVNWGLANKRFYRITDGGTEVAVFPEDRINEALAMYEDTLDGCSDSDLVLDELSKAIITANIHTLTRRIKAGRATPEQILKRLDNIREALGRATLLEDEGEVDLDPTCREVLGYKAGAVITIGTNTLIRRVEEGKTGQDQLLPSLNRIKKAMEETQPLSSVLAAFQASLDLDG